MKFGVHVSIGGGFPKALDRAAELGCETIQIFSSNPRGWRRKELDMAEVAAFRRRLAEERSPDPVVIHSPYLLNLGTADEEVYRKSVEGLLDDVRRAQALGVKYVVLHPGSYQGEDQDRGMRRVVEALTQVFTVFDGPVEVLLENTAGGGRELGGTITQLAEIARAVGEENRLGMCLDTCHAFVAGYDVRTDQGWRDLLREVEKTFGLERLKLLHINDAKGDLGGHLDHHTHIGEGKIGREGFRAMMRQRVLHHLPGILETPNDTVEFDRRNLAAIRSLWAEVAEEEGR